MGIARDQAALDRVGARLHHDRYRDARCFGHFGLNIVATDDQVDLGADHVADHALQQLAIPVGEAPVELDVLAFHPAQLAQAIDEGLKEAGGNWIGLGANDDAPDARHCRRLGKTRARCVQTEGREGDDDRSARGPHRMLRYGRAFATRRCRRCLDRHPCHRRSPDAPPWSKRRRLLRPGACCPAPVLRRAISLPAQPLRNRVARQPRDARDLALGLVPAMQTPDWDNHFQGDHQSIVLLHKRAAGWVEQPAQVWVGTTIQKWLSFSAGANTSGDGDELPSLRMLEDFSWNAGVRVGTSRRLTPLRLGIKASGGRVWVGNVSSRSAPRRRTCGPQGGIV
jgi:hypothetical protein